MPSTSICIDKAVMQQNYKIKQQGTYDKQPEPHDPPMLAVVEEAAEFERCYVGFC
jgi:hypothetical protein